MYRTCLTCTGDLGANDLLEFLPAGRRIAFDAATGRLWVVCVGCGKWNLVPFEQRLETIDACERLFRATPTRYATDQIGLARHRSGVTLIRVGKPVGEEFASWRYGETFRRRRRKTRLLGGASALAGATPVALQFGLREASLFPAVGFAVVIVASVTLPRLLKGAQERNESLVVRAPSTGCRQVVRRSYLQTASLMQRDGVSHLRMMVPDGPDLLYTGHAAEDTARRVLEKLNSALGKPDEIRKALFRVADLRRWGHGITLGQLAGKLAGGTRAATWYFDGHDPATMLALEMHANESIEEAALQGELKLLERQWRDADALAGIADDLVLRAGAEPPGKDF